jgi:hypothetical protein
MSLVISNTIDDKNNDYVRNKMIAFNQKHFPDDLKGRYQELKLHLVNASGEVFGGIVGEFCWNWLEIHYLYVRKNSANQGMAERL